MRQKTLWINTSTYKVIQTEPPPYSIHNASTFEEATSKQSQLVQVLFDAAGTQLQLSILRDGRRVENRVLNPDELNTPSLGTLLLHMLRPVLLNYLPAKKVDIRIDNKLSEHGFRGIDSYLVQLANVIHTTNQLIQSDQISDLLTQKETQEHSATLIYNSESHYFLKEIYEESKVKSPLYYEEFSTGWDPVNREAAELPDGFSPEALLSFIAKNKISRIVSINMYYLELCLKSHNIYLLSVLKHLGVSYHILDWDLYEVNPLLGLNKSAFHCNSFTRFDLFPSLQREWNKLKGLKNISFYPAQAIREVSDGECHLNSGFSVLCAANSRVNSFLDSKRLDKALVAMSYCSEENLFHDFQFWFHCISMFLARMVQAPFLEKIKLRSELIKIHFDGISLLKYEAINGLDNNHKVELYGDAGWNHLFPQHYQNEFLEKESLQKKLQSGDHLYLQVNNVFSYIEANSVISEAIAWKVPFIGFPAVEKTKNLQAFSEIEYSNISELNSNVENIHETIKSLKLKSSINSLSTILSEAWKESSISIATGEKPSRDIYQNYAEKHFSAFEVKAQQYIDGNQQALFNYLLYLQGNLKLEAQDIGDLGETLSARSYVQKIRSLNTA